MRTRYEYEEDVKRPGKFEGEPPWTPYFYEAMLDGLSDDDYGEDGCLFEVTDDDTDMFAELKETKFILLTEDSNGFASTKFLDEPMDWIEFSDDDVI